MMQPEFFTEHVHGTVWKTDEYGLTLPPLTPPPEAQVIAEGNLILRYALQLLRPPHAIIPGLFISEQGGMKAGREAWDWLWAKFMLYPRAEVIGLRSDGADEHLYVRDLDFGAPPRVLVYDTLESKIPLASLTILQAADPSHAPELLRKYLGK